MISGCACWIEDYSLLKKFFKSRKGLFLRMARRGWKNPCVEASIKINSSASYSKRLVNKFVDDLSQMPAQEKWDYSWTTSIYGSSCWYWCQMAIAQEDAVLQSGPRFCQPHFWSCAWQPELLFLRSHRSSGEGSYTCVTFRVFGRIGETAHGSHWSLDRQ